MATETRTKHESRAGDRCGKRNRTGNCLPLRTRRGRRGRM